MRQSTEDPLVEPMKTIPTKAVLVGLILAAVTGGWAESGSAAPKHSAARKSPVTLTVWLMPNGLQDERRGFLELVQPFVAAHPGIKIEPVIVDWGEALSRIEDAVAGRIPAPDITQLGSTWIAAIGATGKLRDLAGKYDEKLFPPQVLTTTQVADDPALAGKRFAVPWLVDARAMYYRKDLCKQAGVDPAKDFETWDSFRAALRKLRSITYNGKPIAPLGVMLANWNVIHNLAPWIWGAGGDFVGNAQSPGIASPESLAGIEFYAGLVREGLASSTAEAADLGTVVKMLREGAIAATISFPVGTVDEEKIGLAPIPAGPRGRVTYLGGCGLAIFKSSPHADEAVALLRYLATEGPQAEYSMMMGGLLAAAGQYDELLLQLDPIRRAFVAQMKYARSYPSIPAWGRIELVLRQGLEGVWAEAAHAPSYDRAAVQRRLDEMQNQIDDILGRQKQPASK